MGKRKKRLTMAKYANKYAAKRQALGLVERIQETAREITNDTIDFVVETLESVEEFLDETQEKIEALKIEEPQEEQPVVQVEEPENKPKKPEAKKPPSARRRRTTKTKTDA